MNFPEFFASLPEFIQTSKYGQVLIKINSLPDIEALALFGSFSRGEFSRMRDLDLIFLTPEFCPRNKMKLTLKKLWPEIPIFLDWHVYEYREFMKIEPAPRPKFPHCIKTEAKIILPIPGAKL